MAGIASRDGSGARWPAAYRAVNAERTLLGRDDSRPDRSIFFEPRAGEKSAIDERPVGIRPTRVRDTLQMTGTGSGSATSWACCLTKHRERSPPSRQGSAPMRRDADDIDILTGRSRPVTNQYPIQRARDRVNATALCAPGGGIQCNTILHSLGRLDGMPVRFCWDPDGLRHDLLQLRTKARAVIGDRCGSPRSSFARHLI